MLLIIPGASHVDLYDDLAAVSPVWKGITTTVVSHRPPLTEKGKAIARTTTPTTSATRSTISTKKKDFIGVR